MVVAGDMLFNPHSFDAGTVVRFFEYVKGDVACYYHTRNEEERALRGLMEVDPITHRVTQFFEKPAAGGYFLLYVHVALHVCLSFCLLVYLFPAFLSDYLYIYIYMYVCMYVCMYVSNKASICIRVFEGLCAISQDLVYYFFFPPHCISFFLLTLSLTLRIQGHTPLLNCFVYQALALTNGDLGPVVCDGEGDSLAEEAITGVSYKPHTRVHSPHNTCPNGGGLWCSCFQKCAVFL